MIRICNINSFVKNSYASLLTYYYNTGIGKPSEITGAVITEKLINCIERRYKQLGGKPDVLYNSLPSKNGIKKKNKKENTR